MGVLTVLVVGACVSSCAPDGGQGSRVQIQTGIEKSSEVVEVNAYYFSAPESFSFTKGQKEPGVAGTFSREVGEKLVKSLSRRPGFRKSKLAPFSGKEVTGKEVEISLVREFIYPSEYDPPVIGEAGDDGIAPVTPATPVTFDKRDLGTFLKTTTKPSEDGKLKVSIDLKRTIFEGFVNYGTPITTKGKGMLGKEVDIVVTENRIEMPLFDVRTAKAEILVNEGDFIAISGFYPIERGELENFTPANADEPEFSGENFVALIQVGSAGK